MNDEFETRVAMWMRDRARPDPASLAAVRGSIDALPKRPGGRRRRWPMATAAVLAVFAIGVSAFVFAPRPNGVAPTGPSRPLPPDPAAFAGDPRLELCGPGPGGLLAAFEMAYMADYQRHLPNAYPLIGLTLDPSSPALVVVYAGPPGAGRLASPATSPPGPNNHDLCVVAGMDSASWEQIGVVDVDTTGLIVVLSVDAAPTSSTLPSPASAPSPSGDTPAPSWASDLSGQLECDGPPPGLGGDARMFASLPAGGFDPAIVAGHWARHEYRVGGRIRALAVTSDLVDGFPEGDGWHVVGIRACDAAEFDPADGLTFDQTLWLDSNGTIERSDRIHSAPGPGHCGWESTIFLRFEGVQYIRDPQGVLADATVVAFDADVALPDDAVDTGLHTGEWRLHTAPAADAVYVVTRGGSVERWGRAKDEIGCR